MIIYAVIYRDIFFNLNPMREDFTLFHISLIFVPYYKYYVLTKPDGIEYIFRSARMPISAIKPLASSPSVITRHNANRLFKYLRDKATNVIATPGPGITLKYRSRLKFDGASESRVIAGSRTRARRRARELVPTGMAFYYHRNACSRARALARFDDFRRIGRRR